MATKNMTPEQFAAEYGHRLEQFGRRLGEAARDLQILGFSCIVITESGVNVISGGDPDEVWRATLRRISNRVANELGQALIAAGHARKPGKPS